MRNFKLKQFAILSILAGASLLLLPGCEQEQGPLEELGENLDEQVNDAQRAVEDAAD